MRPQRAAPLIATLFLVACGEADPAETMQSAATSGETAASGGENRNRIDERATTLATNESSGDAGRALRIVMLGDSLTAGFNLPPDEALPDQIEDRMDALGYETEFVNAGVSGDTTAGGLARYDFSVRSLAPDLLIVALGANDFLSGLDPNRARENLDQIMTMAGEDNLPVVLFSLEPRTRTSERERAFTDIYKDLSVTYGAALYAGFMAPISDKPEYLQPDGLHPTAEGVSLVADKAAEFLTPLIADIHEKRKSTAD
ncbi:MAG: arylesterase [Pseudomonadota bacterium]